MATALVHTCVRVHDADASIRFYEALGFEERGRLNFESAYNVYMGLPGDGDRLELTVNVGREEPYDLGDGYNHLAVTVEDIDAVLATLKELGVEPEKPPYKPGGREELPRIAFVPDPDGYRIELIDGGAFATPQDGPHPSIA
jgi:lactoylglutathione lyase